MVVKIQLYPLRRSRLWDGAQWCIDLFRSPAAQGRNDRYVSLHVERELIRIRSCRMVGQHGLYQHSGLERTAVQRAPRYRVLRPCFWVVKTLLGVSYLQCCASTCFPSVTDQSTALSCRALLNISHRYSVRCSSILVGSPSAPVPRSLPPLSTTPFRFPLGTRGVLGSKSAVERGVGRRCSEGGAIPRPPSPYSTP